MFNRWVFYFMAAIGIMLMPMAVHAHPMGNFSVNHYAKITIENGSIKVRYLIDMAEIPTYQEIQQGGFTAQENSPGLKQYLAARGEELKNGLRLELNGKALPLQIESREVIFPPGAGGLPTMKMGFIYRAELPRQDEDAKTPLHLQYTDNNFPGHAGWKEVIVYAPAGGLLSSSVPQTDRSQELSNYPTDLLNSPPQDLTASISFKTTLAPVESRASTALTSTVKTHIAPTARDARIANRVAAARVPPAPQVSHPVAQPIVPQPVRVVPAAEPIRLQANRQATPRDRFTELISSKRFSFWFLFTAAFIAAGLGAMHALEPGHGKTIVAAYLVGSHGTARHAVLLGIVVTLTHTAGVFALGAVTLYASHYIVPEQLYPWLGAISGLTIAGLGIYMFLRRWAGVDGEHSHVPGEAHGQWFSFGKPKEIAVPESFSAPAAPAGGVAVTAKAPISMVQLLALGITGGIIPCPAALVVLLSAFALHRVGFGLFLIVAFSAGLAAVLIGVGLLMVSGRRYLSRYKTDGPLINRWLPMASSGFMVVLGGAIAFRALAVSGIGAHSFTKEKLGPFLFVTGLGLILGMRHSTDPDHVVAVSTFVSKQISVRSAALIGMMWGLGHTLTIFLVGAAIIVFGVVIPPRIGLSMEFSVALMLILLGVLNLTGVIRWTTERFSRTRANTDKLSERPAVSSGPYRYARPLAVGLVHGLAGSAAVALLVLSTIHNPFWATMYLLIFGAGTLLGMMIMTSAMVVPMAWSGRRFTNTGKYLRTASGIVSICFGLFLVYQIGYVGGLFGSDPRWTPH